MICIGEVKNVSGIYLITNIVNSKVYVGSSINLRKRYTSHKNRLKNGKHDNVHLQNAWNKYGNNNFNFSIIEFVSDKDKLIDREQYWIDYYTASNSKVGYNICPTAGNTLGVKHSDEYKRNRILNNPHSRPILQFDKNGKFVKEWVSVSDLSRNIGNLNRTAIQRRINNKYMINECCFIFKDEFTNELLKEILLDKEIKRGRPKVKKVNQYDKNGKFIKIWDSISLASKTLNINKSNISSCCSGKYLKTAGGFIWSYVN